MIKTIDTENITPEMYEAGETAFETGYVNDMFLAMLAAAPEVKGEPVATLILGGIDSGEYELNDIDISLKAIEALQEKLVTSAQPVTVKLYPHPPATDLVERIRALTPSFHHAHHVSGFNDCLRQVIELIKGAR